MKVQRGGVAWLVAYNRSVIDNEKKSSAYLVMRCYLVFDGSGVEF